MKKAAFRTHKRSVTKSASAVSKARCIHGLPCSVPVASWTLILLLLLTSSFSHVHETGERVAEDAAVEGHEDYIESGKGKKVLPGGEVRSGDSDYNRPESRYYSAETEVVDRLEQAQGIHPSFAGPLDALQYAEYGAELLHKSGAPDENGEPGKFVIRGAMHYPASVLDGSVGLECVRSSGSLPRTNEFLSKDYGRTVDTTTHLGQYSCIQLGVHPGTCDYDRSLRDVFVRSSGVQKEHVEQQWRSTEHTVDGETNNEADIATSTSPSGQSEVVVPSDLLTTAPTSSDDSDVQLNDVGLWESELHKIDVSECTSSMPEEGGKRDVAQETSVEPPSDLKVHIDVENGRRKDSISRATEFYMGTSSDGKMPVESRVSTFPPVGVLHADLDDLLIEECQSLMRTEEAGLSPAKPLSSERMVAENQLEPVKLRPMGQVMSLDEYKRSILEKQKLGKVVNLSTLQTPKTRHSDESYDYAASSHGAKVLSANKEAKGAAHIINSDKDKYLRNPCSAEDKFVVLELSEETFVDTVVIANFEFHSANVKDFEVYGSPVYPTKEWILLGKFIAENVRHRQKFTVEDPKLVRYVMIKLLSHWGSEFFCTLSAVQVFGVDVIKNLLDDWIASEEGENGVRTQMTGSVDHQEETPSDSIHISAAAFGAAPTESVGAQSSTEPVNSPESVGSLNREKKADARDEDSKAGDSVPEVHHLPGGKPPGDSVLKILMQKVKALELNQSLFDNYLEDTNIKYKAMLSELDRDLALLSERLRNETAMSALLAIRLLEMESKMKEEKAYMEYRFSIVASNFTENMEFMRWQIQSMERREITAVILALLSTILSALLHLLAQCMPSRIALTAQEHTLQTQGTAEETSWQLDACSLYSVCKLSSSVVLYFACGLIVLVLSV